MFKFEKRFHAHKETKEQQAVEAQTSAEKLPCDSEQPVSQQSESQTCEKSIHLEDFILPEMKGDMLTIWRYWAGEKLPPLLSLVTGIEPEKLPIEDSALEREKIRLSVKLYNDAKNRANEIQTLERGGKELKLAAKCCCYASDNKMIAWLFVFPPVGKGEKLTSEGLGKVMEQSGVKNGIVAKTIVTVLKDTPYFELIPVAFGTPPVQGRNGLIRENFPHEVEREILMDENGNADYRSMSYVQNVDKGQVLCDIEPPCPGKDGLGVDGKVAPAVAVHPAKIPQGRNTQLSEDGLHLFAVQAGHLEYENDVFHVRPVLDISTDVDYSTGNIDFIGDVHIHGDVRENFTVQAKGTIIIDGLVEAATLVAGGDLLITSGVVGDNRAVLRSAGNIRAKYLEGCEVYAGRNVYADCIVASQIYCDGSIIVTSGRGSIIGGNLTATTAVRAKMIGARSGRQTEIVLGEMPYAQTELKTILKEIEQAESEKESLEVTIADMKRYAVEGERAAKAKIRKVTLEVKLARLEKRKQQIEEQKPDLSKCMIACDIIYPVTKIIMGKHAGYIDAVQNHYKVYYGDDITSQKK